MVNIIKNSQVVDTSSDVFISSEIFRNNSNVKNVNLSDYKFSNSDASMAFANCSNLTSVSNISNDTTNIEGMFYNCSSLVDAPELPNSISGKTWYADGIPYKGYTTKYDITVNNNNITRQFYMSPDNSISTVYYVNSEGYFQSVGYANEIYDDYIVFTISNGSSTVTKTYADRDNSIDTVNPNDSIICGLYQDCSSLVNATIVSDNITNIKYTFSNCSNLVDAEINCSNVSDFSNVFNNCSNLSNVNLTSNTAEYLNYTFNGFANLKNISLNMCNLKSLNNSFSNCYSLTDTPVIPNTVIDMNSSFGYCNNLVNITEIPNSVTNMIYTFRSCTNLVNAPEIPNSVSNITGIFSDCTNLTNIPEIPDSVLDISYALSGCSKLEDVNIISNGINKATATFQQCTNLTNVNLTLNNSVYMQSTFSGCTNLTDANLNIDNVTYSYGVFSGCMNLTNLYLESKNTSDLSYINNFINPSFSNVTLNLDNITDLTSAFQYKTNLKDVEIISNSIIGMSSTFYNCSSLVNVSKIPDSVTSMSSTFSSCSNLVNAPVLSNSVTTLSSTFSSCSKLVNAPKIPDSVTSMSSTFSSCSNLVNAPEIPNSVTNMYMTFYGCSNLVNAPEITENVTNMYQTFGSCSKLANEVVISSPMITNAYRAFYYTTTTKNVYIPFYNGDGTSSDNDLYAWENNEYYGSYPQFLYTKTISPSTGSGQLYYANGTPYTAATISSASSNSYFNLNGGYSYYRNTNADILENPPTTTYNAFRTAGYSNTSRVNGVMLMDYNKDIKISDWTYNTIDGIRELYNYVGTKENVTLPKYKVRLHDYEDGVSLGFSNSSTINNVDLSNVAIINNSLSNMFSNCSNLTHVTNVNENVINYSYAFNGCNNIDDNLLFNNQNISDVTNIFANTTREKDIYIPFNYANNEYTLTYNSFINAGYSESTRKDGVLICNSSEYPDYFWRFSTLSNGTKLLYEYTGSDSNVKVKIKNALINYANIANSSQYYDDYGTFNIQNTVGYANSPFVGKSKFTSVDLNNTPFYNNDMANAFYLCNNLKNVTNINNGTTNMWYTFGNCYNLTDVSSLPNSVISMYGTFSNCYNLVNAPEIPNSVIDIGSCFYNCVNLVNAPVIPNSVIRMGVAFSTCKNLVNAPVIPNSITDMYSTFSGCSNLVNVSIIPNSVTNMYSAFSGCSNLVVAPVISDSVIDMQTTFYNCYNLKNGVDIGYGVTNMYQTFYNCQKISGDIVIASPNVANAYRVFYSTSLEKNVYIPFTTNNLQLYAWRCDMIHGSYPQYLYTTSTSPLKSTSGQLYYANGTLFTNSTISYISANNYFEIYDYNYDMESYMYYRDSTMDTIGSGPSTTYTTFKTAGYSETSRVNGVMLMDYELFINIKDWTYVKDNGVRVLYNYIGNDSNVNVKSYKTSMHDYEDGVSLGLYNNPNIVNVDLVNAPFINNSMSYYFYNCSNLTYVSNINENVINYSHTFDGCNNINRITISNEYVEDVTDIFANTSLNKDVYIPIKYENSEYTLTYNSFINAGYSESVRKDGVLICSFADSLDGIWRYDTLQNGTRLLYEYLGNATNLVVVPNNVVFNNYNLNDINNAPFINNQQLMEVDLNYKPFINNDMSYAFNNSRSLVSVSNINENVTNMYQAFNNCTNLVDAPEIPNSVTNMCNTFSGCTNLVDAPEIPNSIIDMSYTFIQCTKLINAPVIPNSVTNMYHTFHNCWCLINAPEIPNSVTDMSYTFNNCTNLINAPVIPNSVTNMSYTFIFCNKIVDAPVIPNSVTNMYHTFHNCRNLVNVTEIPNSVTDMSGTFIFCLDLVNAPEIPNSVTNMCNTFSDCWYLVNATEIPNSVTDMSGTFSSCYNLVNAPEIPNSVINMYHTFYSTKLVDAPEIPNSVTDMSGTFSGCSKLINAPVIPNSVINMYHTFYNCTNLVDAPVIPNSVTNMYGTFSGCTNLVDAPEIPNSVIDMKMIFDGCTNLVNAPEMPENVTNISYAFRNCSNLVNAPEIPENVTNIQYTFNGCSKLTKNIYIYALGITNASNCFYGTSLTKNVYIPFTYDNGVNSATYNAFKTAGYSDTSRKDGVLLYDTKKSDVTFNITPSTATKYLNGLLVGDICQGIDGSNEYVLTDSSYPTYIGHMNMEARQSYTITKDLTSLTGYTITLNMNITETTATFTINGASIISTSSGTTHVITLNSDSSVTINYRVSKTGYTTQTGTITFNNSNVSKSITMSESPWISWSRPNLSANGTLGGSSFAVQASNEWSSYSYPAYKAVDGNSSTYWWTDSANSGTIRTYTMYNPKPLKITKIVMSHNNTASYKPKTVTIQGSNDNSSWTTITSSFSLGTTSSTLTLTNSTGYKYYKLSLTHTSSSSYIQVKEFTITATYQAE